MKDLLKTSSNYDESHNPALPDKKKPWCLNCRLHTDWYSVYGKTSSTGGSNRTIACKVCDGRIWWPISPTKSKLISIAIVLPCFLLSAALLTNGFDLTVELQQMEGDKLIGGIFFIALGILFAYLVHATNKDVRKHWDEFHKWAEEQSED